MTQQQTENKAALLIIAASLTEAMSPSIVGMAHDQAEALVVTQFERWYNFASRDMLANGVNAADGTIAHPPGVFDDPPATDPVQTLAALANNPTAIAALSANPAGLASLAKVLAPLLALIPGPAGAATSAALAALPAIAMPKP